jgi:hypothetical protein
VIIAKALDADPPKCLTARMAETTKQRLLRVLYPEVDETVAELIAAGMSWRQIADDIAGRAGVSVSHESLRQWYGERVA